MCFKETCLSTLSKYYPPKPVVPCSPPLLGFSFSKLAPPLCGRGHRVDSSHIWVDPCLTHTSNMSRKLLIFLSFEDVIYDRLSPYMCAWLTHDLFHSWKSNLPPATQLFLGLASASLFHTWIGNKPLTWKMLNCLTNCAYTWIYCCCCCNLTLSLRSAFLLTGWAGPVKAASLTRSVNHLLIVLILLIF